MCEYASLNKWGKAWNPDLISHYMKICDGQHHFPQLEVLDKDVERLTKGPDALLHIK